MIINLFVRTIHYHWLQFRAVVIMKWKYNENYEKGSTVEMGYPNTVSDVKRVFETHKFMTVE